MYLLLYKIFTPALPPKLDRGLEEVVIVFCIVCVQ